jgi:adenylylsulfate kinase
VSSTLVWITGMPSAGKSTLAASLHARLREQGVAACLLDGDVVRALLAPSPGYDDEARAMFYATLAGLGAELARQGLVVIVAATANRRVFRTNAAARVDRFVEVFVDVSEEICRVRDSKGLYAAAARGKASGVPGLDAAYERPESPDIVASGGRDERAIEAIVRLLTGGGSGPPGASAGVD